MHGLLGKVFGSGGRRSGGVAASTCTQANAARSASSQLSYVLSTFRFHNDVRPPAKSVAVHDLYRSSAAWQQLLHTADICDRDKMMMLLHPLEIYCLDLRGHNRSSALTVDPTTPYPHTCATDIALFLRDVVAAPARLCGTGMGAMISALTALHTPDMVSSLALFVTDVSQLMHGNTIAYHDARRVLRTPLAAAQTLADVNAQLIPVVPDPTQRAVLLSSVASRAAVGDDAGEPASADIAAAAAKEMPSGGGWHFRYDDGLLQLNDNFSLEACIEHAGVRQACFGKPVHVYLGDAASSAEADVSRATRDESRRRFCELFPRTTFHTLGEADRRVRMCAAMIPETVMGESTLQELAPFLAPGDDSVVQAALDTLEAAYRSA